MSEASADLPAQPKRSYEQAMERLPLEVRWPDLFWFRENVDNPALLPAAYFELKLGERLREINIDRLRDCLIVRQEDGYAAWQFDLLKKEEQMREQTPERFEALVGSDVGADSTVINLSRYTAEEFGAVSLAEDFSVLYPALDKVLDCDPYRPEDFQSEKMDMILAAEGHITFDDLDKLLADSGRRRSNETFAFLTNEQSREYAEPLRLLFGSGVHRLLRFRQLERRVDHLVVKNVMTRPQGDRIFEGKTLGDLSSIEWAIGNIETLFVSGHRAGRVICLQDEHVSRLMREGDDIFDPGFYIEASAAPRTLEAPPRLLAGPRPEDP